MNSFPLGEFFTLFFRLLIFSKLNFFEKFFQKYHLSVKQIESRSGPTLKSGLIWVQTVCKGYQQMTLVGNVLGCRLACASAQSYEYPLLLIL